MDGYELFSSCKKGDISRVRYLVEERDVDINLRDKWDCTPLYCACLCGHEELVQYLLAHGAKCEANTFDGERCVYGSLKDSIRRLLKEHKCITAKTMQRDYFDYFLHMILEQGQHSDVKFMIHGEIFLAHRCVLSARSEYFTTMFETKWKGKNLITLKHPLINPAAFGALLQYIYTGRMDINVSFIEDCRLLAKQCKMDDLTEDLQHKCKQVYEYVSNKPGICVKVLTLGPHSDRLQDHMLQLAVGALPAELRVGCGQLPFIITDDYPTYPDIAFKVEGYNFLCHKAFFCVRSDYFKAMLEDHFSEGEILTSQPNVPVLTLHNISYEVFICLLYYIYGDDTELFPDNVLDMLYVADMYLLPGLKRLCGAALAKTVCEDNVLEIWKTAKLFSLSRLEDQCKELMAKIIEKLVNSAEFAEMIQEDARSVVDRQDMDSIPLVDDIRYHITTNVQTYSAIEEANQKLQVLEQLLVSIGLEC
ncbi:ankyrin repeat and BTB/POZ domain-containing protein 1 [Gadus chalcogrammus]|uniref:ankyrin repeat and BTB/POZ domain-containing protein 1 n=1 Tax=Gadus chalcogrammus TaxID=1042646 RepID=UPI0024C2756F|nr:ankyrin repeat and BTB/POZ domain-containing protein 1 [Gadus chalcogrammus]